MRLLVTGANGFVGTAVCAAARAAGHAVVRAVRTADGVPDTVVVGPIDGTTDWGRAVAGVDVIIHLAARVHVLDDRAADPLARFREVNVEGTVALARQAVAAGVRRLVFVSSIKVNGEETAAEAPFREQDAPAPEDAYGRSKLEAEQQLLQIAATVPLEVVVVRPPLVIGPGVGGNLERLLGTINRGIPLPLGALRNRRSLITRDNLATLLVATAIMPAAAGQLFLAADDPPLSTPDLVRLLARGLGRAPRLVPVPGAFLTALGALTGRAAVIGRLTGSLEVDASKARRLLGWKPAESLTDGVVRCAQAFRARTVRA